MCATPLDGKIRKKITKYYENIETHGSKVIKERNPRVSYFTNTCFFVCLFLLACLLFCFIVCLIANALKSGHCVICIRPVGSFFFVLFAGEGGGTIQRQDEPKVRQGQSRGKWGYDSWEILKSRLSVNAIFAF